MFHVAHSMKACYELRRDRRHYRVAVGAQLPHSARYPISQRENSGFNAPRFSVDAEDEVVVVPGVRLTFGVAHPASVAASSRFSICPCSTSFQRVFCIGLQPTPILRYGVRSRPSRELRHIRQPVPLDRRASTVLFLRRRPPRTVAVGYGARPRSQRIRSAAPQANPVASRSARTPASHSRPSGPLTCSPRTTAGRHSAMRR